MAGRSDPRQLQALREARKRNLLGPTQNAALQEIERRFMSFVEPAATMASAMVAEPVSGFVGLAATPFGSDVATRAINKTQEAMTYQPRTEAGMQGLQSLSNFMAPVGQAFEGASSFLGDAAFDTTGSPALGAAAYSIPTMGLETLGLKAARAIPGRQFEMGDIGASGIGGSQRGAVATPVSRTERLFHATDAEFDEFDPFRTGDRLTALGQGHYLTPNKEKARQYGRNLMEFDVDTTDIIDFKNMSKTQRDGLEAELIKSIPEDRLAGFGERKFKVMKRGKEGAEEFKRLKEQTKGNYHEFARAKIADSYEIPKDMLEGLTADDVVVEWREFNGNLDMATPDQLLNIMQEYDQTIPKRLGYKGARFGDEVAIYDSKLAKKVNKTGASGRSRD